MLFFFIFCLTFVFSYFDDAAKSHPISNMSSLLAEVDILSHSGVRVIAIAATHEQIQDER